MTTRWRPVILNGAYFLAVALTIGYLLTEITSQLPVLVAAGVISGALVVRFFPLKFQSAKDFGYIRQTANALSLRYTDRFVPLPSPWSDSKLLLPWDNVSVQERAYTTNDGRLTFLAHLSGRYNVGYGVPDLDNGVYGDQSVRLAVSDVFLGMRMRTAVSGWVVVQRKGMKVSHWAESYVVSVSSTAFQRDFAIYGSDERLVLEVLDPHLMEMLQGWTAFTIVEFFEDRTFVRLSEHYRTASKQLFDDFFAIVRQVERNLPSSQKRERAVSHEQTVPPSDTSHVMNLFVMPEERVVFPFTAADEASLNAYAQRRHDVLKK